MICIRFTTGAVRFGMIVRAPTLVALDYVRHNQAVYVPRKDWKESGRNYW